MKQHRRFRQRYYCDPEVQNGLLRRMAFYWLACILFLTFPLAMIRAVAQPEIFFFTHVQNVFLHHWPMLMMMVFFLPFAMNDAVKFSNRFVGPIYRLRSALREFEFSGVLPEIRFRKGDFWQDLVPLLNRLGQDSGRKGVDDAAAEDALPAPPTPGNEASDRTDSAPDPEGSAQRSVSS